MSTKDELQNSFLTDEQITSNYQIIRRLGQGAMGQVYLAEQIHVGRRLVALKILNRECAANPQLVKRFESEAAAAGRIQHRNVVTVYESRMTAQGHLYVAMEYAAGRTLREEVAARGALPLGEVVEIAKQICAGLAAAHKLGIVHRDIKPDNIMLVRSNENHDELNTDERLTVKVLDFGIARLLESQSLSTQTAPGLIIGTPAYLSPEQAAGAIGNQIDARADLYSLGMVIYEMITGRVAFYSDSWLAIVRQQLYDPPPTLSQILDGIKISPAVEQTVMRALEKDREKRQQSVVQFSRELEQAYVQQIAPTEPLEPKHVIPPPSQIPNPAAQISANTKPLTAAHGVGGKKNWKLIAGLSAAILAVIAIGLWAITKDQTADVAATNSPPPVSTAPPIHQELMTFRVTRKAPVENLLTLPLDLTVKSDERISFEFKLSQPGAIYLLLENSDHSWRWLDASPIGQAVISTADRWVVMPKDSWYVLDDKVGVERFHLLYVPRDVEWSLTQIIAPARISIERGNRWDGSAILAPELAEKVSSWFRANGVEMKADGRQSGNEVLFDLWQEVDSTKAAFYRIELQHIQ